MITLFDNHQNQFTAADAFKMQTTHTQKTQVQFDKVVQQCYDRIKYVSSLNRNECQFTVPEYIIGYPPYNQNDLVDYVMHHLKLGKFLVNYKCPNHLVISWPKTDLMKKTAVIVKKTLPKKTPIGDYVPDRNNVLNLA